VQALGGLPVNTDAGMDAAERRPENSIHKGILIGIVECTTS
jgi:hypothetical protein